jgi:putative nucleotidyltransferase with HDIG domain
MTTGQRLAMQTSGFGESFEERTFFTGPSSTSEPVQFARVQARRAAGELMRAFVERGYESEAHCERIASWSRRLARELGLSSDRVLDVELGALLHDVGYINLAEIDFHSSSPLTYAELFDLRLHCELGGRILRRIAVLRRAIPAVASHHEEFDGTGYPLGLRGVQIPIDGRIVHLVDAFESLTTDHAHRARVSDEEAREEIAAGIGSKFDPVVWAAFSRIDPVEWRSLVATVG